jgi:hypothetical protein
MSDYSPQALYARISITLDNLKRFMAAQPAHETPGRDQQHSGLTIVHSDLLDR